MALFTLFPVLAAVGASAGWATGSALAQYPARQLGAFEFTRIQLLTCGALLWFLSAVFGLWPSINWAHWPEFVLSSLVGIILGNLAMIELLRQAGPRLTELLMCLKAPIVAVLAFIWFDEVLNPAQVLGGALVIVGVILAIGRSHGRDGLALRGLRSSLWIAFLGLSAAAFQGVGFLAVKPALEAGAEPLAIGAIRLSMAAAIISLIALWPATLFRPHSGTTPYLLLRTVLPGVIGYGLSTSLLLYAYANMEAGLAMVLGSLSPILIIPVLWLRDGQLPNTNGVTGAGLAICGIALIALQ
ncbi:DMT family transporter [Roseibium sp. TrichSKD4]|uniref:DMT family transporter n=1 Tax=Roseibium sp. TrichSKD4 TaxID=744980 RepID=UPI00352727E7